MPTSPGRGSLADDAVVRRIGTDTSGRGIYMSGWMWRCWQALLADPRLAKFAHRILIVQGPWMVKNGGGAPDSEGYHDEGGSIDIRTTAYNQLSAAELTLFILVASEYGFQFWRRDAAHGGMDPHAHGVFGSDYDLSPGAREQIRELLETPRGDGLAGSAGRDYEHRVTPIRQAPPNELLEEDYMATDEASNKLDAILRQTIATRKLAKANSEALNVVLDALEDLEGQTEDIKSRITKSKRDLAAAIADLEVTS